jgi:hypothetical protein
MLPTLGLMTTIDAMRDGGFGANQGWCGSGSAACPHQVTSAACKSGLDAPLGGSEDSVQETYTPQQHDLCGDS